METTEDSGATMSPSPVAKRIRIGNMLQTQKHAMPSYTCDVSSCIADEISRCLWIDDNPLSLTQAPGGQVAAVGERKGVALPG